jgi:hypothetical protein
MIPQVKPEGMLFGNRYPPFGVMHWKPAGGGLGSAAPLDIPVSVRSYGPKSRDFGGPKERR